MTNPLRRFATRVAEALYSRDEPRDYERAIRSHRVTARVVKLLGLAIAAYLIWQPPAALSGDKTLTALWAMLWFTVAFTLGNALEGRATRYEVQRVEKEESEP